MASTQPLRVAGRNGPLPALVAVGGVVAFGLSIWALIEGLAAFERWIESEGRFQP